MVVGGERCGYDEPGFHQRMKIRMRSLMQVRMRLRLLLGLQVEVLSLVFAVQRRLLSGSYFEGVGEERVVGNDGFG